MIEPLLFCLLLFTFPIPLIPYVVLRLGKGLLDDIRKRKGVSA